MTVSREITKWGGKIFFVYLSAIDLTRYEILNFGACARIYAARCLEMWNDARLDRILDNYLQIMKQYLGFEIFLNYHICHLKRNLSDLIIIKSLRDAKYSHQRDTKSNPMKLKLIHSNRISPANGEHCNEEVQRISPRNCFLWKLVRGIRSPFDRGKLPVARGRLAANLEENSTVQIGVHAQRKGGGLKGERRG